LKASKEVTKSQTLSISFLQIDLISQHFDFQLPLTTKKVARRVSPHLAMNNWCLSKAKKWHGNAHRGSLKSLANANQLHQRAPVELS